MATRSCRGHIALWSAAGTPQEIPRNRVFWTPPKGTKKGDIPMATRSCRGNIALWSALPRNRVFGTPQARLIVAAVILLVALATPMNITSWTKGEKSRGRSDLPLSYHRFGLL